MLIMAQDKKRMIDCKIVEVTRNIGGDKNGKYALMASTSGFGAIVIGTYPDEESAKAELEKIYTAFAAGATTYRVE